MNKFKKIIIMMVMMAVCITAIPIPAQAASAKNKKARKAYVVQLKKDKKRWKNEGSKIGYVYADLNGDGVEELITRSGNKYLTGVSIYTYKQGKVKRVYDTEVFSLKCLKYYKSKKVLYELNSSGLDDDSEGYYKFSGNKYKLKCGSCVNGKKYYDCFVNGKTKSASAYKKYVKSLVKKSKAKSFNKLKWKKY